MKPLPFYIPALFIIAAILTVYFFYRASGKKNPVLVWILFWTTILSTVAATGFFTINTSIPPRFFLVLIVPIVTIILLFSTSRGAQFIEGFDIQKLALVHFIRIPIEVVLYLLFLHQLMPQLMTFEGRNFDLLSGLSAPFVWYFGFVRKKIGPKFLLAWNIICLLILLFTVSNAILSAPTPLQKFAFDQPTVAVLYFPFVLLPGVIVPIVIFSHLVTIRRLLKSSGQRQPSSLLPVA